MKVLTPNEALDIAIGLETKAICQDNDRIKSKLLAKARAVLENSLIHNQNHSNLHHALGLCWYWEKTWTSEAKELIEKSFSRAAQLDESNQYATLFLAHFYFDEARYEEALKLFLKIDDSYFEAQEQKYRVLKNHELIICCRLYLNPNEVSFEEIDNLCSEYENTESFDVPVPQEIVGCLAKLITKETKEINRAAERVILMAKRVGFEKAKSIEDNLRLITDVTRYCAESALRR